MEEHLAVKTAAVFDKAQVFHGNAHLETCTLIKGIAARPTRKPIA
jgi:hypothetical protein